MLALLVACHVHDPADPHVHDPEGTPPVDHPAVPHTLYTDSLELFVEIEELMAGRESALLAHFTILGPAYSPLENAVVSLLVNPWQEPVRVIEGKAVRPGIYEFLFKPQQEASVDFEFVVQAGSFADTLELHHIHIGGSGQESHTHDQEAPAVGAINFTKEQAWAADFNVEAVHEGLFSSVITTSGEMTAMPGEKQNISARSEGLILFTTRDLVQGSKVNKGDLLFTISGEGLADNNVAVKFNESKTKYLLSKSHYDRQRKLYDQRIVSERQFLEARSSYITDSVQYYSLAETVTAVGMNIYSPMSGYLHELNVSEGQFVTTGQLLATLSANRVILLRADLPQQHYNMLELISDASFRTAYSSRVYTIAELKGRLLAKGSSVAENNHYLPIYFEVTNDGTLLEGAFVEFYLKTSDLEPALVIPFSALIEEQNAYYVFVQVSGETYTKRPVSIASSDGIKAAIAHGLAAGERIVSRGAMLVKTASISSVPSHGHQH